MLDNQLRNVKENNNYDIYVAIINSNEQSNAETSLYYYFLEQGLSNEKSLAFSDIADEETADLIKKYSEMSSSEFKTAIDLLKDII